MDKRSHTFIYLSDDDDADHEARQMPPPQKKPLLSPQGRSLSFRTNNHGRPAKRKDCCGISLEAGSCGDIHCADRGTITERQGTECEPQFLNAQPWIEKYCPKEISDLAVHSKKVADVRDWMGTKLQHVDKLDIGCNVLVLSGPTGAGKTAVVHVLVDLFQVELCEWDSPVPTLWEEHLHHVNSDVPYISKVNQFIDFLEKAKYPRLPFVPMQADEESKKVLMRSTPCLKPKVLLLDDLPVVHGRELAGKLCCCLHNFAVSVQFPTVVIATDFLEKVECGQGTNLLTANIVQALESGGAKKILFNPITANAVKKVLNKIIVAEKCTVPSDSVSFIAESCGGDIRHAINCLQFLCIGLNTVSCSWDPGGNNIFLDNPKRRRSSRNDSRSKKSVKIADLSAHALSVGCRDGVLSLFHTLGKVLYNKRLIEVAKDSGKTSINAVLKDEYQRHPLNMEAPEILISQSHIDAGSFLYFLHENVLDFVDDEGIEDVSVALTYFSDVDYLLGLKRKGMKVSSSFTLPGLDEIDPGHIAAAVAGSVAARGVLFANTHPAKHRWQSMRAPVIRQVDRLSNNKKAELRAKSWELFMDSLTMTTYAVQAAECEPFYKRLGYSIPPNQSEKLLIWKSISEASPQISEDEPEVLFPSLQEEGLLLNIMAIDISRNVGAHDCDDEIEEW